MSAEIEAVLEAERAVDFAAFGVRDALEVGQRMLAAALEAGHGVTIAIWLGEQRVFHAALPGTSADNDHWVERKAALVRRYDASSWRTTLLYREHGLVERAEMMGLDHRRFAISGGGVPIRIGGTLVGVLVVSGLAEEEDHRLALEALASHRAAR